MRKINEAMLKAIEERRDWACGNTQVLVSNDGNVINVYLHGLNIYSDTYGMKRFTLAGWNTMVTRSRLNALGVKVYGKVRSGWSNRGAGNRAMYKGNEIDSDIWYGV